MEHCEMEEARKRPTSRQARKGLMIQATWPERETFGGIVKAWKGLDQGGIGCEVSAFLRFYRGKSSFVSPLCTDL